MAQLPFYTSEDFERWPSELQINHTDSEIRTPFQIDRDRIIFSYAFRRLQSKTQVFQSGDYDFYRTRLTHSIEVAKIGRSIVERLNIALENQEPGAGQIDADLVEAACLAHDLGHPPFGHIGERTLNNCMLPWGGFEGNAQTLRILTDLIFERQDGATGMQPSRALVDAILKYKKTFTERIQTDASGHPQFPKNHFVYDFQKPILNWVHDSDKDVHDKSLECQIMDWADDTAYSLNDLSDGIQAGYITLQRLDRWIERQSDLNDADLQNVEKLRYAIASHSYERRHAAKIGAFIRSTTIASSKSESSTGRYAWTLVLDPAVERECEIYKRIAVDLIFKSPQIQQNEYRGQYLLNALFEATQENYFGKAGGGLRILPEKWDQRIRSTSPEPERYRVLCDALSSFTDGEAIRLYKRLFSADYGSLSDMV